MVEMAANPVIIEGYHDAYVEFLDMLQNYPKNRGVLLIFRTLKAFPLPI